MGIFPSLNINLQNQLDTISSTQNSSIDNFGKSFLFDFETGDFVVKDGKPVIADEKQSLYNWIQKILKTEKDKYKIYQNTDYGVKFEDLLYGDLPLKFVQVELKREIQDALMKHPLISTIDITSIERDKSDLVINLQVNGNEATINV
jgi:hypothetical protein